MMLRWYLRNTLFQLVSTGGIAYTYEPHIHLHMPHPQSRGALQWQFFSTIFYHSVLLVKLLF